jgi:outer membrane protein assembly factor BamD (BamD/ComL family)
MTLRLSILLLLALNCFTAQAATTISPAREAEQRLSNAKPDTKSGRRYEITEARSHWYNFFIRPAKDNPTAQFAYAEGLRTKGWLRSAGKEFRILTVFWPQAPEAPQAQLAYARSLDARQKWQDAFDEYAYLIEHYPGTFPYTEILQRMFEIAETVMVTRKGKFLFLPGFKSPDRAIPLFEKILEHGPEWDKAPECQFLIGRAHEFGYAYELAITAYLTVIVRYPNSPLAEQAAYHRALCLEHLASSEPNNEATLDEAWTAMHQFAARHPKSEHIVEITKLRDDLQRRRAELAYNRARYYDTIARQPKAALIEYRDFVRVFPHSDWTAAAQKRIEQLAPLVEKNEHAQAAP